MKLSAKFKAYALTCICGVSTSLIFIAAFDVLFDSGARLIG